MHGGSYAGGSYCDSKKMRHFLTKDERVEMLTEYKNALENEAKGVEEKIATLKKD